MLYENDEEEIDQPVRRKKVKKSKKRSKRSQELEITTKIPSEEYEEGHRTAQTRMSTPIMSGLQVGETAIPKHKSMISTTVEQMKRERDATNKKFNWKDDGTF